MSSPDHDHLVPDEVIPHKTLPPLRYRDLPEAPSWTRLVGPSVILAGLALGSGEFVFWPYITYRSGFVFFWACLLGVCTQFFLNMEIERWTLVTGESAITGFCRLSRAWAPIMLVLNVVPWIWPGWATGAGLLLSWSVLGAEQQVVESTARLPRPALPALPESWNGRLAIEPGEDPWLVVLRWKGPMAADEHAALRGLSEAPDWRQAVDGLLAAVRKSGGVNYKAKYVNWLGIASLLLIGALLTTSPVVYNTVERLQFWLVVAIFVFAAILGVIFIRPHALWAMLQGMCNWGGYPAEASGLSQMSLLGALAFAGAGGTMNLGQSNFIKDKGYGMGRYIGRITSPITGQEEPIADVGFHFPHTPENMRRWRAWWRAANCEHLVSFWLTCVVCLMLLALLSYSLFYDAAGNLKPGMDRFGAEMNFIWGQATVIQQSFASPGLGQAARVMFFIMGGALLLTTELGVLDATARISTDIIKVNFLRERPQWTQSRLYFLLLWFQILVGAAILLASELNPRFSQPLFLLTLSAAMNGGVMMIYSVILLYLNNKILSRGLSMSPPRFVMIVWACGFFGYFTLVALKSEVLPGLWKLLGAG